MNDVKLAKNSGIVSWIYLNGLGARQDLLASHADYYCEEISEINSLFISYARKSKTRIIKYGLLKRDESVVVAFSGGPDSTALVVSLSQIAPAMGLQLIVAHFNHGLRGRDADEDERSARRLSKKLGLSFVCRKNAQKTVMNHCSPKNFIGGKGTTFLMMWPRAIMPVKIALGHNLQDQAETVLLHLLRG